jgi:hypothetical protein
MRVMPSINSFAQLVWSKLETNDGWRNSHLEQDAEVKAGPSEQ